MIRLMKFLAVLIVFFIGLLFALRNAAPVQLHYVWGSVETPISYVAFGGCVVGLLLGFLGCTGTLARLHRDKRRLQQLARDAQAEVNSLRKAPFTDVR